MKNFTLLTALLALCTMSLSAGMTQVFARAVSNSALASTASRIMFGSPQGQAMHHTFHNILKMPALTATSTAKDTVVDQCVKKPLTVYQAQIDHKPLFAVFLQELGKDKQKIQAMIDAAAAQSNLTVPAQTYAAKLREKCTILLQNYTAPTKNPEIVDFIKKATNFTTKQGVTADAIKTHPLVLRHTQDRGIANLVPQILSSIARKIPDDHLREKVLYRLATDKLPVFAMMMRDLKSEQLISRAKNYIEKRIVPVHYCQPSATKAHASAPAHKIHPSEIEILSPANSAAPYGHIAHAYNYLVEPTPTPILAASKYAQLPQATTDIITQATAATPPKYLPVALHRLTASIKNAITPQANSIHPHEVEILAPAKSAVPYDHVAHAYDHLVEPIPMSTLAASKYAQLPKASSAFRHSATAAGTTPDNVKTMGQSWYLPRFVSNKAADVSSKPAKPQDQQHQNSDQKSDKNSDFWGLGTGITAGAAGAGSYWYTSHHDQSEQAQEPKPTYILTPRNISMSAAAITLAVAGYWYYHKYHKQPISAQDETVKTPESASKVI